MDLLTPTGIGIERQENDAKFAEDEFVVLTMMQAMQAIKGSDQKKGVGL
jgi:hypothetical protein